MSFNNDDDNRRGFGNDRRRSFGRSARPNFDEGRFNREHPDDESQGEVRKPAFRTRFENNRNFSDRGERNFGERRSFSGERRFNNERSFGERSFGDRGDRNFGDRPAERNFAERDFNHKFGDRRPRPENIVTAMGDADAAPQVAVGGIKEVEELLTKNPLQVHRVLFMHQSGNPKLYELQKLAKRAHVHVQQVDSKILDSYARPNHGVVALMNEKELLNWMDVREEFFKARDTGEKKLIAVATNIEDPRNLGACIRSSLALGVDILLLPAKGMCGITPSVARTSAGALEKLRICRPDNLEGAIGELKMAGYQVLGLDADTETNLADFNFSDHVVLAVGGEDVGLPPFIKKQCDAVLRIPMKPEAHSYNASVALSLGLYEYARLRIKN